MHILGVVLSIGEYLLANATSQTIYCQCKVLTICIRGCSWSCAAISCGMIPENGRTHTPPLLPTSMAMDNANELPEDYAYLLSANWMICLLATLFVSTPLIISPEIPCSSHPAAKQVMYFVYNEPSKFKKTLNLELEPQAYMSSYSPPAPV